ncbi:MAG: flagellar motor protein MotB [Planctomycetota bacterium]|nr:MAG: flagellar motor protein MotB [Planctomycetota bacterium]REJ94378.1 MAG: flagellar motor protein MotB [Planctomycetota bacterium]REK22089.1 MAG: flagellar motor protein MotB [Planctomycetota bacterium]REK44497.1 MAG: flagellar motor protein MotB [Planctomycetota bacterium]
MMEEEDSGGGIPEWVVTFGDMMSLLLTFFIMLVSLSEIKQEELFQAMVESMRQQFGHDTSSASLSPGKIRPRTAKLMQLASMGRAMRANIMQGGNKVKAPVGDEYKVENPRPGQRSTVGTVVYFDHGRNELTNKHKQQLLSARPQLGDKPQRIEVRGHTSRRPLADSSGELWDRDLAYARARAVADYLDEIGIKRSRIRIAVSGQHEPITDAVQPQALDKNDRVEVFLLDEIAESHRKGDAN